MHRQLYRGGTRGAEIKIVLTAQSRLSPMRRSQFLLDHMPPHPSRRRISVTQTTSPVGVMHERDDKEKNHGRLGQCCPQNLLPVAGAASHNQFWIGQPLPLPGAGGFRIATTVGHS